LKPKLERQQKRRESKANAAKNKGKSKSNFRLFKKKKMLEPQAKKRSH
jgi:hypothetical protein